MKRFQIIKITAQGAAEVGGQGVEFDDGRVAVCYLGGQASFGVYPGMAEVSAEHGEMVVATRDDAVNLIPRFRVTYVGTAALEGVCFKDGTVAYQSLEHPRVITHGRDANFEGAFAGLWEIEWIDNEPKPRGA